ncbi:MAG TPA: ABC transporter substrate-binding protein [Actinomycetota bacterium]|nr:ABC transporter substrate-binding protein [Actinomycetota bacterium]
MGRIAALCFAATLVLSSCGGGTAPQTKAAPAAEQGSFPVTIDAANGPVQLEKRPERIVSLSPTATEMLFAVGAGDQVVAVDDQSDYPPEVPTTDLSGFEPNIEAIAKYEPDLVVASSDAALKSLEDLKIPLLVQPTATRIDDTYAQLEEIGTATGHEDDATDQIALIKSSIEEILAEVPTSDPPPTYYHELDETYFSVTSDTFIGQIYDLVGLRNIADKADKAGSGYPQLSAEYIVDSDPDLIFLADSECCNQTPETVAKRSGWDRISAVKNDAVVEVGDDIASRWGPRVVDFLRIVVDAVKGLEVSGK